MANETRPSRYEETWLTVAIVLIVLALSVALLYVGWVSDDNPASALSFGSYVAMTFGVLTTLALGIGLMTLVFLTNRHRDDA